MKLKQLIQGIPDLKVKGSKEVEITGLSSNSNMIAPGNLFIAKKGLRRDGAEFIPQAVASGAAAILTVAYDPFLKQTQLLTSHPEMIEAKLAARYYRNPSEDLWIAGITGSKGKTTVSYLVRHLLNGLMMPAGLSGTIETIVGDKHFPSMLTTHDVIRNQKMLREMVLAGCKAAVLEVSSHGLCQGRIDEIDFDLGLFTNLYPDHLDYHATIEDYAAAKKKLFQRAKAKIFNADNSWTDFMRGSDSGMSFGITAQADVRATDLCFHKKGTSFFAEYGGMRQAFHTSLIGRFNVSNLLAAIAVGLYLGADLSRIGSIFSETPVIPGRLEELQTDLGFRVFVDFAHTGEALGNVLASLREVASSRVIVVFGCGGGRDPERRKGMARAAEQWADVAIVTSDNPRQEDPADICRQILGAFTNQEKAILELHRKEAIQRAIDMARAGDLILIAGKGHERVQIVGDRLISFDDCAVAKEALQIRRHSAILS